MPADRKDLEARIAVATPHDTSRGLNYNSAFAVLRRVCGEGAGVECDPRRIGSRSDFFSYPIPEYLEFAWNAVDRLEAPLGGVDAAYYALGYEALHAFFSASILGRALRNLAEGHPRRLVSNCAAGYRTAVSYGERRVEWRADKEARLTFERDFMPPEFHRGVITAGLEALGARNIRVSGQQTALLDMVFDLAWD